MTMTSCQFKRIIFRLSKTFHADFYRASNSIRAIYFCRISVCPSVRLPNAWIVTKRNLLSI